MSALAFLLAILFGGLGFTLFGCGIGQAVRYELHGKEIDAHKALGLWFAGGCVVLLAVWLAAWCSK